VPLFFPFLNDAAVILSGVARAFAFPAFFAGAQWSRRTSLGLINRREFTRRSPLIAFSVF
jgi:hypothetical protein